MMMQPLFLAGCGAPVFELAMMYPLSWLAVMQPLFGWM